MKKRSMNSKKAFIMTSIIFVLSDMILMFLNNDEAINWLSIVISYLVFCVIYYVVNKVSQAIKE